MQMLFGIFIPVIGTTLGAAMVFFMKSHINSFLEKLLLGFAAGVMMAASIWSLLLPAIAMAMKQNIESWIPPSVGFLFGIFFLLFTSHFLSRNKRINIENKMKKTFMMVMAVTLHNIPEGMAVGIVFAGALMQDTTVTMAGAFSLALGIAIQNFPEGAIISMPLKESGMSRSKSFFYGTLSGIVEPIGALVTIFLTKTITKVLPYLLAFAAGAMIYVVVDELIPESQKGSQKSIGMIGVTMGFIVMMILDIAFG